MGNDRERKQKGKVMSCTIKETFEKIAKFGVILVMLCASGDTIFFGAHMGFMYGLVFLSLLTLIFLSLQKGKIDRDMLMVYVVFSGLIVVSMVANLDFTGYTQWLFAAFAVLVVCNVEVETFCRWFDVIMVWICLFSLGGMGIYLFFPSLLEYAPVISTGNITARNLGVVCIPLEYTAQTFRNYGIFWEPGKFAIYIGIGLLIQLYVQEHPSLVRTGIYLLTLLTTRSTTGIVAVGFLLCLWMITGKRSKFKWILIPGISIVTLGIVVWRVDIVKEVIMKFNTNGPAAASVNSRLASLVVGTWIGITHIFTGAGAVGAQNLFKEIGAQFYDTECFANMITYLFAAFGVLFFGLIIVGLWGYGRKVFGSVVWAWGVVLYFALLYAGQIVTYSAAFYVLVFYGWDYLHKNKIVVWNK